MKVQKKKANGLTKEAVKALMDCPDAKTRTGQRDLVLMIVLYGTAASNSKNVTSFLLGHETLQTTMKYLDITLEDEAKALATLEDEK